MELEKDLSQDQTIALQLKRQNSAKAQNLENNSGHSQKIEGFYPYINAFALYWA